MAAATLGRRQLMVVGGLVGAGMWAIGAASWLLGAGSGPLIFFGYLGCALPPAIGAYLGMAPARRRRGRRVLTLTLGVAMLAAAAARAIFEAGLIQVEGLVYELAAGALGAATLHYMLAKLVGPLIFGRIYCGWACWTAAGLDLLPYHASRGRRGGLWPWLRYLHLALSLAGAGLAIWLWGARLSPPAALAAFLGLSGLAYAAGGGLAFALRDNRAYCKYLCPAGLIARPAARLALLKVAGDPARCNGLGECVAACPMDIDITAYTSHGLRVLSSECTLCQSCLNVCPDGALRLSLGIDPLGQIELLRRAP